MKDLTGFQGYGYDKGRPKVVQALWLAVQGTILQRWWCPPKIRTAILRAFGARIEENVLIRHGVTIHWPWKLHIKKNSWVGVGTWILNLEPVTIGENTCLSQDTLYVLDHINSITRISSSTTGRSLLAIDAGLPREPRSSEGSRSVTTR